MRATLFQLLKNYIKGTDFENDIVYQEEILLDIGQVSSTTVFRFTCDASINADEVYLDNIRIESCPGDCIPSVFQTNNAVITNSESVINIIESDGIVPVGSVIDFNAGDYILMEPGFEVQLGAIFHAFIKGCSNN